MSVAVADGVLVAVGVAVAAGTSVAVGVAVSVGVCVGVSVGVAGGAKPRTAITWSVSPNAENRKSPVTGSVTAPSAPVRPVMKDTRVSGMGSPLESS